MRSPDILLLVVDTLRADRVGAFGARPSPTPALDRLAADARVFERAQSTAPYTMPAVASLLAGRFPDALGIRNHSVGDRLSSKHPTLATSAQEAGYETAAVVTNPWLARPASGFRAGFERFVTGRDEPAPAAGGRRWRMPAGRVADRAIEILEQSRDRPLLLWVHFMDTHMPYAGGEEGRASNATLARFADDGFDRQALYFDGADEADVEAIRAAYDSSVARVDAAIARILAATSDDAIVVVVADHGESLGEHGLWFAHDFTLYQELVHVPLILRLPHSPAGRVRTPVSLVDLFPTLCEATTLVCPGGLDGIAWPRDAEPPRRDAFSVSAPLREKYSRCPFLQIPGPEGRWAALRRGDRKLIRVPTRAGVRYEAYDLRTDPGESRDTFDPAGDAALVAALERWFLAQTNAARAGESIAPADDAQTLRELRALGYSE